MQKTNFYSACILLIIAITGLLWVIPAYTKPVQSQLDIAPSFMPSLACGVIGLLALSLAIQSLIGWKKNNDQSEAYHEEFSDEATGIGKQQAKNILLWTLFSLAAMWGLSYVGFYITAPVILCCAMIYASCRNPLVIGVVSITAPLLIGQIVWYAFSLSMP